jgi:hypothetical protein
MVVFDRKRRTMRSAPRGSRADDRDEARDQGYDEAGGRQQHHELDGSTIESKRLVKLPRLDSNQQPFGSLTTLCVARQ